MSGRFASRHHASPRRHRSLWPAVGCILLIAVAGAVAYKPSLRFFFSQDDFVFLARAARVDSWVDFARSFAAADHFYRPVPRVILFFLELRLFGLNAAAFHLVNLGLHIGNAVLLFLFLLRLFGSTRLAGVAALTFVTHPVSFLAVYWVSGMQDLSMTTFVLLSLLLYLGSLEAGGLRWRVLSLVFFALALLSKEMAVAIPLLLIPVSLAAGARGNSRPHPGRLAVHAAGHALLAGLYLIVRAGKAASLIPTEGPYALSLAPRTVLSNLWAYQCDALFVRDLLSTAPWKAVLACALFLLVLAVTWWRSHAARWPIALGASWFVLTLMPVLFLSQRAYSFYAYLPLAGMALLAAAPLRAILGEVDSAATRRASVARAATWAGMAVLLAAWLWFSTGQVRAQEVRDPAGILSKSVQARETLAEVQARYPALPQGSTLYVVGLTERDTWAYGQGDLFRLYYPDVNVVLLVEGEEDQVADTHAGSSYVFRPEARP